MRRSLATNRIAVGAAMFLLPGSPHEHLAPGLAIAAFAMQLLKRRLLRAEARRRVMAQRDPLTGFYNRRRFDAALEHSLADPEGTALSQAAE
jgi:hypothetical protein